MTDTPPPIFWKDYRVVKPPPIMREYEVEFWDLKERSCHVAKATWTSLDGAKFFWESGSPRFITRWREIRERA